MILAPDYDTGARVCQPGVMLEANTGLKVQAVRPRVDLEDTIAVAIAAGGAAGQPRYVLLDAAADRDVSAAGRRGRPRRSRPPAARRPPDLRQASRKRTLFRSASKPRPQAPRSSPGNRPVKAPRTMTSPVPQSIASSHAHQGRNGKRSGGIRR